MLDRLETTLRVRGGARLEGSVATHGAKNAALPIMAAVAARQRQSNAASRSAYHRRLGDVVAARGARRAHPLRRRQHRHDRFEQRRVVSRAVHARAQARRVVRYRRSAARPFRPCGSSAARRLRARHARDRHARASVHRARVRSAQRARLLDRRVPSTNGCRVRRSNFVMPSVGATKNAMLAAVVADGTTTISNVAMEPEVVRSRQLPQRDGREDRGHRHRYDGHRRRQRTARRRIRNHSRSHRHRHAAARRARSRAAT